MSSLAGRSRDEVGAAAVEFALVSVLLFVLILGMAGVVRLYQLQIAVTHAAREGARMASVAKYDAATVRAHSGIQNPAGLQLTLVQGTDAGGKYVEVTASYPVSVALPTTPSPGRLLKSTRTFTPTSTARMKAEF